MVFIFDFPACGDIDDNHEHVQWPYTKTGHTQMTLSNLFTFITTI